jgi:hypothetical protein
MYQRLLRFYPADLHRDYGAEMTLVFVEDLESARREAGLRGVVRVWTRALGEFVRFALLPQAASPLVLVPALTFAVFAAMMSVEMGLALRYLPAAATPLQELRPSQTVPLFSTPFISLAVVLVSRRRIESLGLSSTANIA